ncbi:MULTISPECIES: DUF1349 domain-containing protein [Nocardiopsis]|uniref:DUF1349 domain-containing protein n=1 Tax=Nocardiopsis lambiniae TaxID=3075539 RepID=A0ABU2MAI8_9ACTN|nr:MULTISPECIES: DUF1349 domain-containing protein [unclassified Nocardiopsis]MDE3723394.1 DUF1349 domain-containing protein [Nocardiopsis sp. N85]MDT0329689.1 DUF1349 domain-containing protein [Nocardiopsis sp. DSM 44743]
MFTDMTWLNEPPSWRVEDDGSLTVVTADGKDFWRHTHYGFVHDDGHFLYTEVSGDFVLQATFNGDYGKQYDQAGLMLRADEENWIKTGTEFVGGGLNVSSVVTRGHSDWSVVSLPRRGGAFPDLTIRVIRTGEAVNVQYLDGWGTWRLLRLAHLPLGETCLAGVMCCSPEREGFRAVFRDLSISSDVPEDEHT